jgi:hypothetical protein
MANQVATVVIAAAAVVGTKRFNVVKLYIEQIAGRDWLEDISIPQQSTK